MLVDPTSLKSPQACARPGIVLDFLRASRKVSDDNIRNRLGQVDCGQALSEIYSEWERRDSVLTYCKNIEGSLDITSSTSAPLSSLVEHSRDRIEFPATKTDPRVDAYTSRNEVMVTNDTFNWIRTEELAESIIRDSTTQTLSRKCGLNLPPYNPK